MASHLVEHVCHCGSVFHRLWTQPAKNCSRECRAKTQLAPYVSRLREMLADGCAVKEIAEELGLSKKIIRSAIYRLKKRDERSNCKG